MLLSEARTRVKQIISDTAGVVASSNTIIDDQLRVAQETVWLLVTNAGVNLFTIEADIASNTSGVIDLSSINPIKIVNLSLFRNDGRLNIYPARLNDSLTNYQNREDCKIAYVPRITFPATDSDPFVWGNASFVSHIMDQLVCYIAASYLTVMDNNPIQNIVSRMKKELEDLVKSQASIPTYSSFPLKQNGSVLRIHYIRTNHNTLQLVY